MSLFEWCRTHIRTEGRTAPSTGCRQRCKLANPEAEQSLSITPSIGVRQSAAHRQGGLFSEQFAEAQQVRESGRGAYCEFVNIHKEE